MHALVACRDRCPDLRADHLGGHCARELLASFHRLVPTGGPLLVQGDENWLKAPLRNDRRDDRRGDRGNDRGRRPERASRPPEDDMERFRVEVGHRDRVKPGNLVGAIANESGLEGRMIGRIQIFETHSLVDLPKGMPENVFNSLRRLKVMNRELQIRQDS